MEVQIRTWEMHDIAERGIAAHWKYKEGRSIAPADEARVHYFKSLIEELTEGDEATSELIEGAGSSPGGLADEEIFVFTPTGAVRVLSRGATPVDFAFTVHSEVGLKCSGAKVNGVMAPLHTQLKNGDTVEILTSPNQRPSPDWLRFVKTTRTKSRIRAFLQQEAKERFAQTGRQLVEKELKKFGVSLGRVERGGKFADWARSAGISEEALWVQIGAGKVSLDEVGPRLAGVSALDEAAPSRPLLKQAPVEGFRAAAGKGKVLIGGHADIEFRFARCCSPVVGEPIVGFVSKGHGISIHAASCTHARRMDPERFVAVEWAAGVHADQVVGLKISAYDSTGMLNAISSVFAEHGVNIRSVVMRSEDKRPVKRGATSRKRGDLLVKAEISTMSQLKTLLRALLRVDGVIKAERSS
jgi:GTP pyrophosphokinase